MKNLMKNGASLFTLLLLIIGLSPMAIASTLNPDNLLVPVEKKGKYAKLDVSSLPIDKNVAIKVRDENDILVYELNVKNTGQHKHVLVDFNRLKTGVYSINILRGENDVIRKNLDIRWDQVIVRDVVTLTRDIGHEHRWPLNSVW